MRVLIAPDKFKGSLTAPEVAKNVAIGFREVFSDAQIELAPIADGGEGTAEVIHDACDGEWRICPVHDALGNPIQARYLWLKDRQRAVMEMSEAAGVRHMMSPLRDPMRTNTVGVGEMLRNAMERGATEIIIGLGGSVTNDGGFGMARALGYRFLAGDKELQNGPGKLEKLTKIIRPGRGMSASIIAAADVRNPLLGSRGATRVFGPQKGVRPEQFELLEKGLQKLADRVKEDIGCDFRDTDGAGAAGGLGFGLMSFCGAELHPGFSVVAGLISLEDKIINADVVITGEGGLDLQTLEGKGPAGVARLARSHDKAVYAIAGYVDNAMVDSGMFNGVYELARPPMIRTEAIKLAAELLRERARELAGLLRRQ